MSFRGKACSKNDSLLERVDSRVQHIWRLQVMGSCRKEVGTETYSIISFGSWHVFWVELVSMFEDV